MTVHSFAVLFVVGASMSNLVNNDCGFIVRVCGLVSLLFCVAVAVVNKHIGLYFWYCSGASVKVVFNRSLNAIDLSGPAAAVDAAHDSIQSHYVDAICHGCLELCLPGNWLYFCILYIDCLNEW